MALSIESNPSPKTPMSDAEVNAIQNRSRDGDKTLTVGEVRAALDACPSLAQANGSPARHLTDSLLDGYSESLIIKESVRRKVAEVRADLEGPNPTPLESLLAERASICWLTVNHYESSFARSSRPTYREAEYQQRRIDAAHRRFLSAVKTLAMVRKLALPSIQVNIGENQVNVATPA